MKPNAHCEVHKQLYLFCLLLAFAGALIFATISVSNNSRHDSVSYRVEVLASANGEGEVYVEPFGYFMGEWNLWEFIGDSIAALLIGA